MLIHRFRFAAVAAAALTGWHRTPPPAGPLPWRWVTERVIAPPDGTKGELGEIVSLAIADDGTVYAMQKSPASVLVFAPDGKYLRTIGSEGDGPGELRSGVLGVKGDLLMVQDWSAGRFTIFRTNGDLVKTMPSLCCRQYGTLHIDSSGKAWVEGPIHGHSSVYLRIDPRGRVIDTIPAPEMTFGKSWTARAGTGLGPTEYVTPIPGQPYQMAGLRYDGLIQMGRSDSMRFVLSRNGRDTVKVFEGPTRRQVVTAAEKKRLLEATIDALPTVPLQDAMRKVAKASEISGRSNAWEGMMLDRENRTWVGLPGGTEGTGQFGVFDRNGKYLGEVPFPKRQTSRLFVMGRDRIAVLEENGNGMPEIHVYKLMTGNK